jgi:hypothetical protein
MKREKTQLIKLEMTKGISQQTPTKSGESLITKYFENYIQINWKI